VLEVLDMIGARVDWRLFVSVEFSILIYFAIQVAAVKIDGLAWEAFD
jgi:hypothetical protein